MKNQTSRLFVFLALWASAVAWAGSAGIFRSSPPLLVPLLVAGLSVGLSVAVLRWPWLSRTVRGWGERRLVAFHLMRFVGLYFLWLSARGRLPVLFAERAGWGDVAAAAGAGLLVLWPGNGAGFRGLLAAWNVAGMFDLLLAVGTAGWLNRVQPGAMDGIISWPLVLVPLFFVPVLMASHWALLLAPRQHRPSGELAERVGLA